MNSNQIVFILIGICSLLLVFTLFQKQVFFLVKFIVRSLVGVLGYTLLNGVLGYFGMQVGINLITVAFVGLLGIWGFLTMIVLQIIL